MARLDDISGLQLWLGASRAHARDANGAVVESAGQWAAMLDASGNGFNFTQATGASQPVFTDGAGMVGNGSRFARCDMRPGVRVPGDFTCTGIAYVPPLDAFAIGDFTNDAIKIVSREGVLLKTIDVSGSLDQIQAVAYDPTVYATLGITLWVGNAADATVRHFDYDGSLITSWEIPSGVAGHATGVTVDPVDGSIWTGGTTSGNPMVKRNRSTGASVATVSRSGSTWDGIHRDRQDPDVIWSCQDDRTINKYSISGNSLTATYANLPSSIEHLTEDDQGKLWITFDYGFHAPNAVGGNRFAALTKGQSKLDDDIWSGDFKLAFWVKQPSSSAAKWYFSTRNAASTVSGGIDVAITSGDKILVQLSQGASTRIQMTGGTSIDDDAWHLIAVDFDRDGNMRLFVDPTDATDTDATPVAISAQPGTLAVSEAATIYGYMDGTSAATGTIRNFAMWSGLWTTETLATLAEVQAGAAIMVLDEDGSEVIGTINAQVGVPQTITVANVGGTAATYTLIPSAGLKINGSAAPVEIEIAAGASEDVTVTASRPVRRLLNRLNIRAETITISGDVSAVLNVVVIPIRFH